MSSLTELSRQSATIAVAVAQEHHGKHGGEVNKEVERAIDHLLKAKGILARAGRVVGDPQAPFEGVA